MAIATSPDEHVIQRIREVFDAYFDQIEQRVPTFVDKHLRYPGVWHLHRSVIGWDLIRAPLNLLWAPVCLSAQLASVVFSRFGKKNIARRLKSVPTGFHTCLQRTFNHHLDDELFKLDALSESLSVVIEEHLNTTGATPKGSNSDFNHQRLRLIIEQSLRQLMLSRTATQDISSAIFATAVGALSFNKFTPGGIGLGIIIAALWAKSRAVEGFFFGSGLGALYYGIFPPSATAIETIIGVAFVMMVMAIVACFSGLLTDPLLARLGLHQRRLNRLIRQAKSDLHQQNEGQFSTPDPYIARILDLIDTARSQLPL